MARELTQGQGVNVVLDMVAGGYDYLLKVCVPDMAAYRNFLGAVLSGIPGIHETHSYPVMEEVKDAATLNLGHLKMQA